MEPLTAAEVRVLGCLVEKQMSTPEYYPLTLNALTAACNQKVNRDPVVELDEKTVVRALDSLRDRKLAWVITAAGARVPKYDQAMARVLSLTPPELAVLCELMLRGPQTSGELRSHAGRLHPFAAIPEVEVALATLSARPEGALVVKLPRQLGQKEQRYAHLLSGEPQPVETAGQPPRPEGARLEVQAEEARLAGLEEQCRVLRQDLDALRQAFEVFRRQFE
jgi:uncharacterized protein YceH (UPF0502 family)